MNATAHLALFVSWLSVRPLVVADVVPEAVCPRDVIRLGAAGRSPCPPLNRRPLCISLQPWATSGNSLQRSASARNALQHLCARDGATHGNTVQRPATLGNALLDLAVSVPRVRPGVDPGAAQGIPEHSRDALGRWFVRVRARPRNSPPVLEMDTAYGVPLPCGTRVIVFCPHCKDSHMHECTPTGRLVEHGTGEAVGPEAVAFRCRVRVRHV